MSNEEGIPQGAADLPPFPTLAKGTYGPVGCDHEAECEIVKYGPPERDVYYYKDIVPVEEACEGPRRFRHLEIQVRSVEFGAVKLFCDQPIWEKSGSKLPEWAGRLGVDPFNHSYEDILGAACAVEVSEYTKKDGSKGNRLEEILGV